MIQFDLLGWGNLVKFRIKGWRKFNTILDYNAPYQKDTGFFFLRISKAVELISSNKCSEMDIILDLRMNTIYNDEQVAGSDIGPVVYMRNGTCCPLVGYSDLAARWGISKATVGRILKKPECQDFLSFHSFPSRHGSVIYLKSYLSTMFSVSDVMVDKDEVAMALNIRIHIPEALCEEEDLALNIEEPVCVSNAKISVSKTIMEIILSKVLEMLTTLGLACCSCQRAKYKLYPLSADCKKHSYQYLDYAKPVKEQMILEIRCGEERTAYTFKLTLAIVESRPKNRSYTVNEHKNDVTANPLYHNINPHEKSSHFKRHI